MSSAAGTNVLRYTALGLGVFYGFYHQRQITATQNAAAARHEYERKQRLIQQAKAEYAKRKNQSSQSGSSKSGVADLSSPNFDIEAYVQGLIQ